MKLTLEVECLDLPPNIANQDTVIKALWSGLHSHFSTANFNIHILEDYNETVHSVDRKGSHGKGGA